MVTRGCRVYGFRGSKALVGAQGAAAVKHFYSSHSTIGACYNRGNYWLSQHPSWGGELRKVSWRRRGREVAPLYVVLDFTFSR